MIPTFILITGISAVAYSVCISCIMMGHCEGSAARGWFSVWVKGLLCVGKGKRIVPRMGCPLAGGMGLQEQERIRSLRKKSGVRRR
jgi:hypothetical protein